MSKQPPQIKSTDVFYKDRVFNIEYFYRQGEKETIVLLHGLGGQKKIIMKPANPLLLPAIHYYSLTTRAQVTLPTFKITRLILMT